MGYLLDTNIVTAILKDNQVVVERLSAVRLQGKDVFISCITYLETEAGLLYHFSLFVADILLLSPKKGEGLGVRELTISAITLEKWY